MKTIHIIDSLKIGGVEVGILNLIAHNNDYRVITVNGYESDFFNKLPNNIRENITVFNTYSQAVKFIKKYKPDVIISSLWRSHLTSLISSVFLKKVKRVHFVHSARFAHVIDRIITKISLRNSQEVICDSIESQNWLYRVVNCRFSSHVVPMNISFSNGLPPRKDHTQLTFIFAGRMSQIKRLDKSIEFIEILVKRGYSPKFDIFGPDSGTKNKIIELINDKNLSEFIFVNDALLPFDVEKKMRNYSFYLQNSDAEGMAISVFQSVLNGLIPIVTPVGEISKYTIDNYSAVHIDNYNLELSVEKFITAFESEFDSFTIGKLNVKEYPEFSSNYFNTLSKIGIFT